MLDTIKVFVEPPSIVGYTVITEDPFHAEFTFNANVAYHGIKNDTIFGDVALWSYSADAGSTPGTIYSALYASILEHCQQHEYPPPGQKDIFAHVPTALSQIFVEIPSLA